MKPTSTALAVFAGIAIGAVAVKGVHAQTSTASKPLAYYVSEFEVTDPEGMKPYSARVESTFQPFGGRYIVRGGKVATLEGEAPKKRIVIIAFDNMEKAQAWYNSPAYAELKPIRHRAAKSQVFILEGTGN